MTARGWILSCRCRRAGFRGFRALPLCWAVRAPSWPCSHELIRLWSTGSGVRLQVDVDAHAGQQRRLADEIDHDLQRVDVSGLARAALADVALFDLRPDPQRGEVAEHDQNVLR